MKIPPAGARRQVRIPVGGGLTVIKLNVHPLGCECGCASRGARAFLLNRPGEHVANRPSNDLDEIVRRTEEWALDALQTPPAGAPSSSPVLVGGGATTITLTVDPRPGDAPFVVALPETGETSAAGHLPSALATMRTWAERALAA